jgi:type IV pilus assembly protein PilV
MPFKTIAIARRSLQATKQASRIQKGFTLLEVLVAVVILAIGMLGIAALLLTTQKSNSSSYIKQQAVQSAYDILDRMRANNQPTTPEASSGAYDVSNLVASGAPTIPSQPAQNCEASTCTPAQMAAYDTWHWLAVDLKQLPNGCGSVTTAAAGSSTLVTVTVQWDDSPASSKLGAATTTAGAGNVLAQFSIQTLL